MPNSAVGDDSRIVVIENKAGTAAIVADRLCDLRTLDAPLDPPPVSLARNVASLLLGVASTPTGSVRVLDTKALLTAEPLRAFAASSEEGTV
jgi:chemotaxis signal transduction protein